MGAHFTGNEVLSSVTGCHSAAGSASSASCSSLTLTGLRVELCGWVELALEPSGLAGL